MIKMFRFLNITMVTLAALVGVFLLTSTLANKVNSTTIAEKISKVQGTVIGFDGSLLAIEFNDTLVKPEGDTEINSFLVDSNGSSIQLKPVIIPSKKAAELGESKTLVFPISDILSLLEPKLYAIEVYVKNSKYMSESVQLPLIILDLSGGESKPQEKLV